LAVGSWQLAVGSQLTVCCLPSAFCQLPSAVCLPPSAFRQLPPFKIMRIISGEYRGRILKSPADNRTRPTSDRLRETLFNVLNPKIHSATRFLDLCAGTGAIGIEAISRGAGFAAFVDKSKRACALIEENLDLLKIPEEQTEIFNNTAEKFVAREPATAWDIVFYDPPYQDNYRVFLFEFATRAEKLLTAEGILIVEHHAKNLLPDAVGDVRRWRILKQGETHLSFFQRN
ncbi:MAG: 16S rRNA (guanine(966)-N(2))-methyltransferase RsmD, partial [Pyrinomonadaceae bacterium]|nr:16S rRNA (guanine(966)-N(2))-methyltransferase RsmD [Pyrinomonadaceae bacterium]